MALRADPETLVPVAIVGGYLGAGKTTLINHLLSSDHGQRLAVLVNDFGAIDIDADLLASHEGDTIALSNGCVCCAIGDALGDALDSVLEANPRPDRIVIEASGVADPAKIAGYGQGWPGCRLDAVVVLADAETIRVAAADRFVGTTVVQQLRSAGILVLTKVDLVASATLEQVRTWLEGIAPGTPVVTSTHDAPATALLIDAFDPASRPASDPTPQSEADPHNHLDAAAALFESFTLDLDATTRPDLDAALAAWPPAVVRVKGFVRLAADTSGGDSGGGVPADRVVRVDRVGTRVMIEPLRRPPTSPTGLVVIALKGQVDPADLRAGPGPYK